MVFDWKSLVKSIAPTIGTALGGPLGGVAGLALYKALGIEDAKDDAALSAAIQGANPDQLLKIQQADHEFALQMQKLGFENIQALEQIAAGDRANARDREVKTGDSWTPRILSAVVVAGFLWCLYYVLSGRVQGLKDPGVATLIGSLIGYASAKADTVVGYYFGSSAGSDRKTEMLRGQK